MNNSILCAKGENTAFLGPLVSLRTKNEYCNHTKAKESFFAQGAYYIF